MENLGKNVVFIPIRGGSKSIPLKNIKMINGKPLVYWALDAAEGSVYVDKIIISTDSDEIKSIVEQYGSSKLIIINRSAEVSTDTASTESVMLEFAMNYEFENIILIQATSPLINSNDLSKGIEKFSKKDIQSVISVVRQKRFLWEENENTATPINYNPLSRPRRQEFEGFLVENGAFYITSKTSLLESGCRISGNIGVVEMEEETYFEIDEPSDWMIIEAFLKKHKNINLENKLKNIKCLLTDCDGVLTDAGMYYSENGDELKKFNTKDGMGFKLLKDAGIITGIITGENVEIVKRRAKKLKMDEVHLGIGNKIAVVDEICKKYNLNYDEIAYIGDDINDMEVIQKVGFGCTVKDGMPSIIEVADYATLAKGGEGAAREVAELILKSKRGI